MAFRSGRTSGPSGMLDTSVRPFQAISCAPNGSRWSRRISEGEWNSHRKRIEDFHKAGMTREAIHEFLKIEDDFHPSMPQLNGQMTAWGLKRKAVPGRKSALSARQPLVRPPLLVPEVPLSEDHEQNDISSMLLQLTEVLQVDQDVPTAKTTALPNSSWEPQYCDEACCTTAIFHQRKMLGACFLMFLKCWPQASGILQGLIDEMTHDKTVSTSSIIWAKANYNRIYGGGSKPDDLISIWTTPSGNIVESLWADVEVVATEALPSPLMFLCLTGTYRAYGELEKAQPPPAVFHCFEVQLQTLTREIQEYEEETTLLLQLLVGCSYILESAALHSTFEHFKLHVNHVPADTFHDFILPRLLACHIMSAWIDKPRIATLSSLAAFRNSSSIFKPDVLLPELFVTFSHMIAARIHDIPPLLSPTFVSDLKKAVRKAVMKLCFAQKSWYCAEIAKVLLSLFHKPAIQSNRKHQYMDQLALKTAHKIMGTGYISMFGSQPAGSTGPLTWMRSADCFKVKKVCTRVDVIPEAPGPQTCNSSAVLGKQRTESVASNESTLSPPSITGSTVVGSASSSQSSCPTLNSVIEEQDPSSPIPKSQANSTSSRPTITRSATGDLPRRFPTSSSGRLSFCEILATNARVTTNQMRRQTGSPSSVSRTDSRASSSRMTMDSQYSFRRVFGIEGSVCNDGLPQRFPTTSSAKMSIDGFGVGGEETTSSGNETEASRFSWIPGASGELLVVAECGLPSPSDTSMGMERGSGDGDSDVCYVSRERHVSAWIKQHSYVNPGVERRYSAD
ncbi:hypothetical protein LTS08_008643 [Lithohypha guttulata]|nr:hypothetical protein LTS08_008643 [Lithohypha guttulata]